MLWSYIKRTIILDLNILRQKNLKIDNYLKKNNEDNAKLDKAITHILDYISRLNSECSSQKQYENVLDSENCTIQNKAMEKLQVRTFFNSDLFLNHEMTQLLLTECRK